MKFTFEMKMKMADDMSKQFQHAGLAVPAANYAAVVITEEVMWKLKRFGMTVKDETEEEEI